jgi:MFS family permease
LIYVRQAGKILSNYRDHRLYPCGAALAALNCLIAAIQTGFGPFVNLTLVREGWTQARIGIALSAGTIAALICQVPGGALVDAVHQKRIVLAAALAVTGVAALLFATDARVLPVLGAEVLHSLAATVLTPAIAAVTLSTCGHGAFGGRLGNNVKWASLGSAGSAILLGLVTSYLGSRTVFLLTAVLCLSAVLMVGKVRPAKFGSPIEEHPALMHPRERRQQGHRFWALYMEAHLHRFASCVLLFHFANAAMLSLAVNALAARGAGMSGLTVSAAILVSQVVVAIMSASLGHKAEQSGRRPLLLLGFAVLPIRGLLLAMFPGAIVLVCTQALDGISGAVMGIMVPLVSADLTRRTGFLSLAIGSLGLAAGVGATASTAVGAWIAHRAGTPIALLALSLVGFGSLALVWVLPETRPPRPADGPDHVASELLWLNQSRETGG